MKLLITIYRKMKNWRTFVVIVILLLVPFSMMNAQTPQNRIHFAGKDIFISGLNIAWSSSSHYALDLGPSQIDEGTFNTIFETVHDFGGNVLRFWMHTNGKNTPAYGTNGYVTGPGSVAIRNMRQILDLAKQNNVGVILCLWTHNMLSQTQLDTAELHRNAKLLKDTSYTNAYIRNALLPMVDSLKGNPAIVAWEIFNEPEGISNEYGWPGLDHVSMVSIQRCVNLMAGAIHRADSNALITSGAVTFQTLTDVISISKTSSSISPRLSMLPLSEQKRITSEFNALHMTNLTASELEEYFTKISLIANSNFYRDDRLIASGGDSAGILDFYSVHYYAQNGQSLSPFVHPASAWKLSKPIVAAEFYMQKTDNVEGLALYPTLYQTGYAGGMVWSWTDFGNPATNSETDTWESLLDMSQNHPDDVLINLNTTSIHESGTVNSTVEKTNLYPNYPNPFNPITTIKFSIVQDGNVSLTVFDILGRKIVTLTDKYMKAGAYTLAFDAARFASGVYFYRLETGKFISQKKMVLLR